MVHRGGSNCRNGARTRLLSTPAGDVELRIPKVRAGSFFPSLLKPRRRVDRVPWAEITTAYVPGTSTHKVDNLVKTLWLDTRISKSTCLESVLGSTLRWEHSAPGVSTAQRVPASGWDATYFEPRREPHSLPLGSCAKRGCFWYSLSLR